MIKRLFIYLFIFFMLGFDKINATEIVYLNNRFDYLYEESKTLIKNWDLNSAKTKIYEYIDKTNFIYCEWFNLLIDIEKRNNNSNIEAYEKIYESCNFFNLWNYKSTFESIKWLNFDNYKDTDKDLYVILNLYFNTISRVTIFPWYEKLYDIDNSFRFLTDNKDYILKNFRITYWNRMFRYYYEKNDKEKYSFFYDTYLKKSDFIDKLIVESFISNTEEQLLSLFKYENSILEDKSGGIFYLNIYQVIYKKLYELSYNNNDIEKSIQYFFRLTDLWNKVKENNIYYSKSVIDFMIKIENLKLYKDIILENILSDNSQSIYDLYDNVNYLNKFLSSKENIYTDYDKNSIISSLEYVFSWYKDTWNTDKFLHIKDIILNTFKRLMILNSEWHFDLNKIFVDRIELNYINYIPELKEYKIEDILLDSYTDDNILLDSSTDDNILLKTENEKKGFILINVKYIITLIFILLIFIWIIFWNQKK